MNIQTKINQKLLKTLEKLSRSSLLRIKEVQIENKWALRDSLPLENTTTFLNNYKLMDENNADFDEIWYGKGQSWT